MSFNGPSLTKVPPMQPNGKDINIKKYFIIVYCYFSFTMVSFTWILGSVIPRLPPKPLRPPTTMFNFNAPPGSS